MNRLTFSDYAAELRELIRGQSPDGQEGGRLHILSPRPPRQSGRSGGITVERGTQEKCASSPQPSPPPRFARALRGGESDGGEGDIQALAPAVPDATEGVELPTGKSEQMFNNLALGLFALQFDFNLPYRRFCEGRGVSPAQFSDWTQIPAIPASAFKELELSSLAPAEQTRVFHSSGTSEQRPSRHFHNAESLAVYEASLLPWFKAHFFAGGQTVQTPVQMKMSFLTPPPALASRSSLVHMFEVVRREFGAPGSSFAGGVDESGAWVLDVKQIFRSLADAAMANQPLALLGTAFNFVHLVDDLAEKNARFELPPGSRVLETGGYKGRSRVVPKHELHSLITEHLGVRPENIICEYGMSELSSQAYGLGAQGQERVFRFPPWARVQIISPETGREAGEGETGLIRVLDLANVWSVMALQTEDLGIRRGRGFELIGRARLAEPRGCSLMMSSER